MMSKTFGLLFFIRKPKNKTDEAAIFLRITIDQLRTEISTKRYCNPKHWNSSTGRVSETKEEVRRLNAYLDTVQAKIYDIHQQLVMGNEPITPEGIKNRLVGIAEKPRMLLETFLQHNEQMRPCIDEFATIRVSSIQTVIATGRSNDIVTVLSAQDYSHLKKIYSKEEAETIFNMTGNIISGQVSGETAKLLSDRFPKIMQDRQSISINSNDTSISKSKQLESSVPAATISSLSSGEFIGVLSDTPKQPIELKTFHAKIAQNKSTMTEKTKYEPMPSTHQLHTTASVQKSFVQIKEEIKDLAENVFENLLADPTKEHLLIRK